MLVHRAHAHLSPFRQLSAELDRMFESFFTPTGARRAASFAAVDLRETDEAFLLEAELPGVRAEEVELLVDGTKLTLRAQRSEAAPESESDQDSPARSRRERPVGAFEREFDLPSQVDADAVEAKLDLGVLTARLPKLAADQPRRIAVKTK